MEERELELPAPAVTCINMTHGKENRMTGYKNAPHIAPSIGDEVECGLPGSTAIVASIDVVAHGSGRPAIINCAVDGKLHLNYPGEAVVVRTADGMTAEAIRKG